MDSIIYAPLADLASAIDKREISSVEVVSAYLERINDVNPEINAVVNIVAEQALEQARAADDADAEDYVKGPLFGIPMTIKDSFETAGVVSTSATKGRQNYVPSKDATAVARLRSAGAILMGKTNLPEFTWYGETDNVIFGRTSNPYDLSLTAGGSSGGSAAILAAGGSPLDLGSDTYCSIRQPAHFCGIAGIKPTSGRVPRTGHFPPPDGPIGYVTQVGTMSRYVDDLILTLPIIAGPDGHDPDIVPMPLGDPEAVEVGNLRVAFYTKNGVVDSDPEVATIVKQTAAVLDDAGCVTNEAVPACFTRSDDILSGLFGADGGASAIVLLEMAGTNMKDISPFLQDGLKTFKLSKISTAEFFALYAEADRFRQEALAFMQDYDVIISPPCGCMAFPHGKLEEDEEIFKHHSYSMVFNLLGWPAAVVRAGTSSKGLPIGVQIAAKPWREDVALAVAKHIEAILGGFQRPPL